MAMFGTELYFSNAMLLFVIVELAHIASEEGYLFLDGFRITSLDVLHTPSTPAQFEADRVQFFCLLSY